MTASLTRKFGVIAVAGGAVVERALRARRRVGHLAFLTYSQIAKANGAQTLGPHSCRAHAAMFLRKPQRRKIRVITQVGFVWRLNMRNAYGCPRASKARLASQRVKDVSTGSHQFNVVNDLEMLGQLKLPNEQ